MRKKLIVLIVSLLPLLVCGLVFVDHLLEKRGRAHTKIIVSKETTYLLAPLDSHGYIDYVSAINEAARKGVTTENNAVVLLWQTLGPRDVPLTIRDPYFSLLGTAMLPENGDYYNPPSDALDNQRKEAMKRPWSETDFPELAAWLTANDKYIENFHECSRRTRYFSPLVPGEMRPRVMSSPLPAAQSSRELAYSLSARAMLRIHGGKVDDAFQDSLACHRLGRLVGQGPSFCELLVAISLDEIARRVDLAIAENESLTADQAQRFTAELKNLPPLPNVYEKVTWAERLLFLDAVAAIDQNIAEGLAGRPGGKRSGFFQKLDLFAADAFIDPNDALRSGNKWFDRMAEAASQPTWLRCREACAAFDRDLRQMDSDANAPSGVADVANGEASKRMGDKTVGLLFPAAGIAVQAVNKDRQSIDLVYVAFALGAYRADHGRFPPKLADLAPKYVSEIPKDIFSDDDLHYQSTDRDYLLYSVGPNGTDENGRDDASNPPGDDVVVRVSRQQPPDSAVKKP